MSSVLLQELDAAFERGEMDSLKGAILPFIRAHRKKILEFIEDFQKSAGPRPLDVLIKMFIVQQNLPFDMGDYMKRQHRAIQQDLGTVTDAEQRRRAVTEWIRRKADDHRSRSMFQQVFCFEKMKERLLPQIEEELGLVSPASGA